MQYENFRLTTFIAGLYNGPWPAAPPADLQPPAVIPNHYLPMYGRIGVGGGVVNLNVRDVLRLKRFSLWSNFADGLILKQGHLQVVFGLGPAGTPQLPYGTVTVPVIFLNTWIETHLYISDKALVQAAIDAGALLPTANLTLYCTIVPSGAPPAGYCTAQINPALAALADPAPAGTANLIFTLAAEVEHSYGET